jgi:superfamily II DNA/RNA helicase
MGNSAHMGNKTGVMKMSEIQVKTGKGEEAKTVSFNYDIPETVSGLVEKYGEEQVAALAGRAITLALQAQARQKIAAGADHEAVQAAVNAWQPGVRGPVTRKSPLERAEQALSAMSPEDLAALLAKVKAKQKGH